MSSLDRMLSIPSFRDSVRVVLNAAADSPDELRRSLNGNAPPPTSGEIDQAEWRRAGLALRLIYEFGLREPRNEVLQDIQRAIPDASASAIGALEGLIQEDPILTAQIHGIRRRDGFLPILSDIRLSVDLRVIDNEADPESVELAPVVTARFEFDEPIHGADGIVFQIPLTVANELVDRLEGIRNRVTDIREVVQRATIPGWAVDGLDE